jgi:archaellum biogenesis protein FlaJ (TadC family)
VELSQITANDLALQNVCAIATDRYHRIAMWRQLFTALIFSVAVVMAVLVVLCIVFATNKEWAGATATALGTAANGIALKWVLARYKEATSAETKAFKETADACDNGADDAKAIKNSLKLI